MSAYLEKLKAETDFKTNSFYNSLTMHLICIGTVLSVDSLDFHEQKRKSNSVFRSFFMSHNIISCKYLFC